MEAVGLISDLQLTAYCWFLFIFCRRKTFAFTGRHSPAAWRLLSCCWMPTAIWRLSTSTETLLCTSLLGRIAWIASRELWAPGKNAKWNSGLFFCQKENMLSRLVSSDFSCLEEQTCFWKTVREKLLQTAAATTRGPGPPCRPTGGRGMPRTPDSVKQKKRSFTGGEFKKPGFRVQNAEWQQMQCGEVLWGCPLRFTFTGTSALGFPDVVCLFAVTYL